MAKDKRKRLRPAGHSAVIEGLVQPAIVVASTLMSAIAAYVLALDELTRVLADWRAGVVPSFSDLLIITLCVGMGFLVDMAIIVSATRYKMHKIRGDAREEPWLRLATWVLVIGLTSETMTLFYFFVHLSASSFPGPLVSLANLIHSVLAISRAFLPPVVIAYFAAGVLPIAYDRADRNREIKARTSQNAMVLIDRLSEVAEVSAPEDMLKALGGQLMLGTYAEYDQTARTSETDQIARDGKLVMHLARMHGLDWSAIGGEVAPELTLSGPVVDATPDTPPDGPGGGVPQETGRGASDGKTTHRVRQLRPFQADSHPRRLSPSAEAARKRRAFALLDATPDLSKAKLRRALHCGRDAANGYYADWQRQRATAQAV